MAFHIDVSHLPSIRTYANAKRIFDESKAVRGGSQSIKRIGRKYDNSKWLMQEMIDGVEVYIAGYHHTNLVYYYPTHYEISMGSYDTISTRLFIEKITGVWMSRVNASRLSVKGIPRFQDADFYFGDVPIATHQKYAFHYDTNMPVNPDAHPKVFKYSIDRKAMRDVRAPYQECINYIKALAKLDREEMDRPSFIKQYGNAELLVMMNDKSLWGELYEHLRMTESEYKYDLHSMWNRVWFASPKRMLDRLDQVLKTEFAHVVLQSEVVR